MGSFRQLRKRLPTAGTSILLVGTAALWLACATIPEFLVASGPDATADALPVDRDGSPAGDGGPSIVDARSDTRKLRFFVTSEGFPGNFGALDAGNAREYADNQCARLAQALGKGPWRAVIWSDLGNFPTNLNKDVEGWYQVTTTGAPGELVLTSIDDEGRTDAAILTEQGNPSSSEVWTGGTTIAIHSTCDSWRDDGGSNGLGSFGVPSLQGIGWFEKDLTGKCGTMKAFYCAERPY